MSKRRNGRRSAEMKNPITAALCANAGVSITTPEGRIWIDALHDEHEETFSDVTPAMWDEMKTHPDFRDPDVLVFTHLHGDHFSRRLLEEAMRLYPHAKVILPSAEESFRQFTVGQDEISCIRTLHEGRAFTDTLHEAVVIESTGRRILLTGDMRVDAETAAKLVRDFCRNTGAEMHGTEETRRPSGLFDTVFAAFPWETTTRGRKILEDILRPEQVVLYHIPFQEDDLFEYRDGVRKVLTENGIIVKALMEPFEKIEL